MNFESRFPKSIPSGLRFGRGIAGGALLGALVACSGIGDGNTLNKLELVPASQATQARYEQGGPMRLYQCLRSELKLLGTFDSGQVIDNFNERATWSSSNEAVVKVSNRDLPLRAVVEGEFADFSTFTYLRGTVVPVGNVGETATITAKFAGLSASIDVVIRKPVLRVVPVPNRDAADPFTVPSPINLGVGSEQRLAILANFDGRVSIGVGTGILNNLLNPIRWSFVDGDADQYQAIDDDPETLYDNQRIVPTGTPEAAINTAGTVHGLAVSGTHGVAARFDLCPDATDPDLAPDTTIRVLPFDTPAITLERQPDFHAAGTFTPDSQFVDEDVVAGTDHRLSVTGHLDVPDGMGNATQYLGEHNRFEFSPSDIVCDTKGLNCTGSSLFSITANDDLLRATLGASGKLNDGYDLVCLESPDDPECVEETDDTLDPINIEACFPFCASRLASLAVETPLEGPVVTLTATATNMTDGAPLEYLFDCGDGTGVVNNGAVDTYDCDYTGDTGPFTATVRVVESGTSVTINAGAVSFSLDAPPAGNTAPTATLNSTTTAVTAPARLSLTAVGINLDVGDSVAVYEFYPDESTTIRQSSPLLNWVYLAQPAEGFPKVVVYDSYGTPSAAATVTIDVNGTAPAMLRSTPLTVVSQPATPCAVEIVPPVDTTETAFTFPGLRYYGVASFIAKQADNLTREELDAACDVEPLIGTQDVTRLLGWLVQPEGESEEASEIAGQRNARNDFQHVGQVFYLASPDTDTTEAVNAFPIGFLGGLDQPAAASITVQPCPVGTCPE